MNSPETPPTPKGSNADDLQQQATLKARAALAIEDAIATLAAESREPDLWEWVHLEDAAAALFRGAYHLAIVTAKVAMTPPDQRSSEANLKSDLSSNRRTLARLREALEAGKAEPVRAVPHLGPIVFEGRS